jgi:hypothetical protein
MKCRYSAFNAQGWRLIIVVVQLGAVKIYVAGLDGGAEEKGKTDNFEVLDFCFEPSLLGGSLFFNERRKELVLSLVLLDFKTNLWYHFKTLIFYFYFKGPLVRF